MFYSEFMGMTGFWIILLALLMADVVSTEYQPPTLKTLLTQNKSRTSILLSKIAVTLSMALLTFVIVTALAFLIVSIFIGPGSLDHKMIFNQQFKIVMQDGFPVREAIMGTGSIITVKQFLGYSLIQLLFFSFAMSGFMVLFSTITRNTLLSLAFTVMIPFFIIIVAQFMAGTIPFADFNPFIYGNFKASPLQSIQMYRCSWTRPGRLPSISSNPWASSWCSDYSPSDYQLPTSGQRIKWYKGSIQ